MFSHDSTLKYSTFPAQVCVVMPCGSRSRIEYGAIVIVQTTEIYVCGRNRLLSGPLINIACRYYEFTVLLLSSDRVKFLTILFIR